MSAPVVERPRRTGHPSRTTAPVIPAQRVSGAQKGSAQKGSAHKGSAQKGYAQRTNAQKAYARKEERLRRLVGGVRPAGSGAPRRAQFVLLVMVLLGTGLVLTLWLSTAAAADSYRLQDARAAAGSLGERSEQLRREVAVAGSAPEIARRAGEMGMVAVQDPARVVVAVDGSVVLVGEPQVAQAPAPPVIAAPAPGAVPAETPADETPADEATDGAPADEVTGESPADAVPGDEANGDEVTDDAPSDEVLADGTGTTSDQAVSDQAVSDQAVSDQAAAGAEPATAPN